MGKSYQENHLYQNQTFQSGELPFEEYDQCRFLNCVFLNVNLSGLHFNDCVFEDCDLSMATLKDTAFRDVKFKNCKLLGLRFDECNNFSLSFDFEGCMLQFSSFFRLKIPRTVFKDCKIEDVEFVETDLSNAAFYHCDLSRAVFENTILESADLQTAQNFSIDPDQNRIQKARFSTHNIAGLLHKYRIVIH